MKNWYHNSKTGEIDSYESETAGYELRGLLMAYGDAVTIGFKTKQDAIDWSKIWGYCPKCKGSASGQYLNKDEKNPLRNNKCFRDGTELIFTPIKMRK
jgi:hypothetical protein